jgi:hypothetical protein
MNYIFAFLAWTEGLSFKETLKDFKALDKAGY